MTKVLMFGWELFPYNSGGLGEACLHLTKSLSSKGVDITFVLPQKLPIKADHMKIIFANVNEELEQLPSVYLSNKSGYAKRIGLEDFPPDYVRAALKFAERTAKLIRKVDADIIHAHDWLTFPAAITAQEVLKKPLVVHVHSTEFDRTGGHSPNPHVYKIEKDGFDHADKIIPVGGFMKDTIASKYDINPDKISVVYNGINDPGYRKLAPALTEFKKLGNKIVLFLGRITLQKGPEYFVWAAKKVLQYNPKVIFVVTGSGDMQSYMIAETARLGISDRFIFTGFLRGDDRDRIFQAADLYVMPSVSEPFGLGALEAICNGTPALVSKQSGVSEILKNALKVDFWDINEMANKILAVLSYEALPEDLKKESGKEIKNFSWSNSADKVLGVYNSLT
jgi:glycosyltransferase involved in cell wall biosynthesis